VRRAPEIREGEESFAVPGTSIENFLGDAELRGADRRKPPRDRDALANRKLARCGLCRAPSFRRRHVYLRADFDARIEARIAAGPGNLFIKGDATVSATEWRSCPNPNAATGVPRESTRGSSSR
jgi:hypothetical protein